MYKRKRSCKDSHGLTIKFALLVGLIGIALGLLLNFMLSSPPELELSTGPNWSELDRVRIGPVDMKSSLVHDEAQIKPSSAQVQTQIGPLEAKPDSVHDL